MVTHAHEAHPKAAKPIRCAAPGCGVLFVSKWGSKYHTNACRQRAFCARFKRDHKMSYRTWLNGTKKKGGKK